MRVLLLIALLIASHAPAVRADSDDVVAGAIILLGAAAIMNRVQSDRDGAGLSPDERSEFQRGYRDGLNYAVFDVRGATDRYVEGYQVGIDERNQRVDNHRELQTPRLPPEFNRACRVRGAEAMSTTIENVQVVRSRVASATSFLIEVRQARSYGNCQLNRRGEVVRYRNGRF
jgi:hypothetical protein